MTTNKIIYESILDDDDLIVSQNRNVSDLVGDEYAHTDLADDNDFEYMLIISFDVWGSSSYKFIQSDKPDEDVNKFPLGKFCQELNDILEYNMFISKYQISRVVVNDRNSELPETNKNYKGYEIIVEDPLANPDYIFNIVNEYRAVGGEKFLGLQPIFNIYVPFIPPKKLPFMRMCNSIYQLCQQMRNRLGRFALDISDDFSLKWRTIHPTDWMNRPYTFSKLYTKYCHKAEEYLKIYKHIYGEDVPVNQTHDIMRYKLIRNVNLWHYAEQAAKACKPSDGVSMELTTIYEPGFDTMRFSSIDSRLLSKATRRTIPRVVGFEVNPGESKEVDIDTLEDILVNDFILKLPAGYCNSCLLTICVRCNVNLKNNVHTDENMRDALKDEIRERQDGYGRMYDWIGNNVKRWVFNPCTRNQVKVENTDCHNETNGKRTDSIWRIVDMTGENIPTIRVFFCDKNGRVNRSPISEITWYGEEYRIVMPVINDLMESGEIWQKGRKFDYSRYRFGLW